MSYPHPELAAPPELPADGLRVVPLGGLGEIGRNMTVFEYDGKLLIVDCGVLFPEADQPGVDLILPDFGYLENPLDDVVALVLTHGHEDHIGAVPYLLRERRDIPLIGSRLTLALLEAKLTEHRIKPVTDVVAEGERRAFGPFDCEFFAVNHSIPDALALAVRTPAGLVLHTGDFKMDQLPLDGRLTDLPGFARLGGEGIDLLLSDSTNAEVPGFVTSERNIGPVIDEVFRTAQERLTEVTSLIDRATFALAEQRGVLQVAKEQSQAALATLREFDAKLAAQTEQLNRLKVQLEASEAEFDGLAIRSQPLQARIDAVAAEAVSLARFAPAHHGGSADSVHMRELPVPMGAGLPSIPSSLQPEPEE